ncbi:MAG: Gfo/Idh/MocA family protein [Thermoguttaceae bacterium]
MNHKTTNITRRSFLAVGAGAVAAPLFLPGRILGKDGTTSPNSQIVSVSIGMGNRGSEILGSFMSEPFRTIGICDCYEPHIERAKIRVNAQYRNQDCLTFKKYEDILERDDVDVIAVSTPDHWHTKITVDACKAGKDVFCEKPLTLTLAESQQIVEAARKNNRIVSSGSQRVMEDYGYMAPIIQSGAIGDVQEVFIGLGPAPKTCYLPEEPIPTGMDWDRWLGQAPWAPYNPERCSGNYGGGWRQYEEYCNGFLADWGAHKYGGALYALGLDLEDPVEILPANTEKNPKEFLCALYKNGMRLYHGGGDIKFVGTEGTFEHGQPLKPKKVVDVRRYSGGANNIYQDFAYCVKNRVRPFQDVAYGARTAAFCILMNICYKLNRPLRWNQSEYRFEGDEQANRMISRAQRSPYTIEV